MKCRGQVIWDILLQVINFVDSVLGYCKARVIVGSVQESSKSIPLLVKKREVLFFVFRDKLYELGIIIHLDGCRNVRGLILLETVHLLVMIYLCHYEVRGVVSCI